MRRTGRFEDTSIDNLLPDDYEAILDSYIAQRQKGSALKATKPEKH